MSILRRCRFHLTSSNKLSVYQWGIRISPTTWSLMWLWTSSERHALWREDTTLSLRKVPRTDQWYWGIVSEWHHFLNLLMIYTSLARTCRAHNVMQYSRKRHGSNPESNLAQERDLPLLFSGICMKWRVRVMHVKHNPHRQYKILTLNIALLIQMCGFLSPSI